jgi:hypothetical protein
MASELGLRVLPLLAASGTGMNLVLGDASGNLGKGTWAYCGSEIRFMHPRSCCAHLLPPGMAEFVSAAVAEALTVGFSGYNVQLEEPGNATIKAAWVAFLGYWLDEFGAHNLSLSIIIGGVCQARDWMYMDCGDYRALADTGHSNLRVITEATYTGTWSVLAE